jgi:Fic family protein
MIHPATLKITPEILGVIAELDEFKGAWRALGTLAPERLSALRRVATIESIGSSTRIEGSKLSDREVEKLLSNLEIKSFHTRDEQEVAGYAETMELIFQSWDEIALTEFINQTVPLGARRTTRLVAWIRNGQYCD